MTRHRKSGILQCFHFKRFYWALCFISVIGLMGTLILQLWPHSLTAQEAIEVQLNLDYTNDVALAADSPLAAHTGILNKG